MNATLERLNYLLKHLSIFGKKHRNDPMLYHSMNPSMCFPHFYILHLAFNDLQTLQEELESSSISSSPSVLAVSTSSWSLFTSVWELYFASRSSRSLIFFRKYLSFNTLFVLFISNGSRFYGFIHCFNICRSCFKIHTWFLKLFSGTTLDPTYFPTSPTGIFV